MTTPIHTLFPGGTARIVEDMTVSGYNDPLDLDTEYTCTIAAGTEVEIIGEPISASDLEGDDVCPLIAIRALDTDDVLRDTVVELDDLTVATLS